MFSIVLEHSIIIISMFYPSIIADWYLWQQIVVVRLPK